MKFKQEIYLKLMGGVSALLIATCLFMAYSTGCATLDKHSAVVNLAVSQVTLRYIEQTVPDLRRARAERVLGVVAKVKAATVGDKPVTIAELADFALSFLPANLEASDRALAISLIQIAAQELSNKVGTGELPPDAKLRVSELLAAVESAASYYAGH